MAFELPAAAEVLGMMITPAVLISASGTLSLATSNRLGRVVDRVRTLGEQAGGLPDGPASPDEAELRNLIADQLTSLAARIRLLQNALTVLYAAIGLLVGTSLTIGLTEATRLGLQWLPMLLGLGGAGALFVASMLLVREARLAVRSSLAEIGYVRRIADRKAGRIQV
jgi:hypothetical protein